MPSRRYQLHYKLMAAYPEWISGIECERFALENNFKGSNAGRRLRELENDGILERRLAAKNGKRYVEYKYIPRETVPVEPVQQSLIEALK